MGFIAGCITGIGIIVIIVVIIIICLIKNKFLNN